VASRVQGAKGESTDTWLTDPKLVRALGPFQLDPCCPADMPWRTAKMMFHFPRQDGLELDWKGRRVWLNFPFSAPKPWVDRFVKNANGIALAPGRSPETLWCQQLVGGSSLVFVPKGRLPFFYPDGTEARGKWQPHILVAYGEQNAEALRRLPERGYPGLLMKVEV